MPTTFEACPEEVIDFAAGVLKKYHPDLAEAGVTIDYAFAINEEEPPLRTRGQRVLAKVKLYSLEDRARGCKDAKITIDESWWNEADERERAAVLDHEHEHLQFAKLWKDPDGALKWKTDDLERPKLKIKNHDAEAGVFFNVIQRHEDKSADLQNLQSIGKTVRNLIQRSFWG